MPRFLLREIFWFSVVMFFIGISCTENDSYEHLSIEQKAGKFLISNELDSAAYLYKLLSDSLYTAGDTIKAVEYSLKAGKIYLELFRFSEVDSLFSSIQNIKDDRLIAEVHALLGKRFYDDYNFRKAEDHFLISERYYEFSGDTTGLLSSMNNSASVYLAFNNFRKAEYYIIKAEKMMNNFPVIDTVEIGNHKITKGNYYFSTGSYSQAFSYFNDSYSTFILLADEKNTAKALNAMGNALYRMFEPDSALACFNMALEIRNRIYGPSHPLTADIHSNIGLIYDYAGEPARAIDSYNKALETRKNIFGNDSKITARTYTNLANAHKDLAEFELTEFLYKNAISILEKNNPGDPDIAVVAINLGEVLSRQEKYKEAIYYLKLADRILRNFYSSSHIWIAVTNLNLSIAEFLSGDSLSGMNHLKVAEKIALSSGVKNNYILASVYTEYGLREKSSGRIKNSLSYFQKALRCYNENVNTSDYLHTPDLNSFPNDSRIVNILTYKADALRCLKESYVSEAYKILLVAVSMLDKIRAGFREESSAVLIGRELRDTYSAAVDVCYELYSRTEKQEFLNEAFCIIERSKSYSLFNKVIETRAKNFAGIPDSLLSYERSLKTYINSLQVHNSNKNRLFELKQEYLKLLELYESKYPFYYNLKYNTKVISAPEVQSDILSGQNIIQYFYANEVLYTILLCSESAEFRKANAPGLDSLVSSYRSALMESNYESFVSAAFALYKILIKPLTSLNEGSLIVVPDGILNMISFDTLIDELPVGNKVDYKRLSYLVYRYEFSYTYSCSLLKENILFSSVSEMNEVLGMAPY